MKNEANKEKKRLRDLAADVFGSRKRADEWFKSKCLALDSALPRDVMKTPDGPKKVEDTLTRIKYCVYT